VTAGNAGKDGILNALSYRTRRQVVYDSLFYIISRRVPGGFNPAAQSQPPAVNTPAPLGGTENGGTQLVDLLRAVRKATGEDPNTGCGPNANCLSPDPSRNELFRALVAQRFQSGQYALRQIDEPENNAREQVVDQALQLMQMNDQLELMDHYSLLLSSEISNEIVERTNFTSASPGAHMP